MKKSALFSRHGFTLIELVVVISIIAILSTIALFGFSKAQASGRDASRQQTMNGIRSALERFYADNQKYPSPSSAGAYNFADMVNALKTAGYLTSFPVDPSAATCPVAIAAAAGTNLITTGMWQPCSANSSNPKGPVYIYDTSTTTPYDGANCIYTGNTLKTSGCVAACSAVGSCYSMFLLSESSGTPLIFKSPQ